jgi:nucleoside-diphosphate-sugar epimerase
MRRAASVKTPAGRIANPSCDRAEGDSSPAAGPKIFVLGGQGFVGSAIVRAAREQGYAVAAITRENRGQWCGRPCDLLIDANGNSKKFLAESEPAGDFQASVASVLRNLLDFPCRRYVYLSSIDVYPRVDDRRCNRETAEIRPERLSRYGLHKFLAEQLVRNYAPHWLICRLGGMVGAGLWKNPVFDILSDQPLRVHADSRYQYLHTADAARIILDLVARQADNDVFNLCGDGCISLAQVAALAGKPELRYAAESPPVEHYDVNLDKLRSLVSVPRTEATIRKFVRDGLSPIST